ncbi:MAG: hypothetical protein GX829_10980, partial [Clostridium sp.]|nr:hypothetical protein [Clostridium sp.]
MNIKQLEMRKITGFSLAISGILYFGLGLIFLLRKETLIFAVENLLNLLVILLVLAGVFQVIGFTPIRKKENTLAARFLQFLLNMIMALIIYLKPEVVLSVIPLFFGAYAIFTGLIKLLSYVQYRKNSIRGKFHMVISASVIIVFGLGTMLHLIASFVPLSNLIGIFFILYGLSFLIDALQEGVSGEKKDSFKRRIRISLPMFMVALVPHQILTKINKALETDTLDKEDLVYS